VEEVMSELDPKKVKLYRDSFWYLGNLPESVADKIPGEYSEMIRMNEEGKLEPVFQNLLEILPPENFTGPENPLLYYLAESVNRRINKIEGEDHKHI
jgi:hypothetical protein